MPGSFTQSEIHPPLMRFEVQEHLKNDITTSNELPEDYVQHRVPGTAVEFTKGPFGAYFTQEIRQKNWVIGWINFDIHQHTFLLPVPQDPFIGLYCGLHGTIPCKLTGMDQTLTLPENKFGFYYVPGGAVNLAEFKPNIKAHYRGIYLSISPEFLLKFQSNQKEVFAKLIDKQVQRVMKGEQLHVMPISPEAHSIINKMKRRSTANDPNFILYQDGKVVELLIEYFKLLGEMEQVPPALQDAVAYMAEYFDEKITDTELAAIAGMDEKTFKKEFRAFAKMAPQKYILLLRVAKVKQLLVDENDTILSIAQHLGFTDDSHLNKAFMKHVGMKASEYRNKHR